MFENENDDNGILLGQMCYDELEPTPEEEEEINYKNIDGQIGIEDLFNITNQTTTQKSENLQNVSNPKITQTQVKELLIENKNQQILSLNNQTLRTNKNQFKNGFTNNLEKLKQKKIKPTNKI